MKFCLASLIITTFLSSYCDGSPSPVTYTPAATILPVAPTQGFDNGYFYSIWEDNPGFTDYANGPGGSFSVRWRTGAYLGAGKGWNPGTTDRVIKYNGTFQTNGNSMLGVYGWSRKPLVEYYVSESFGVLPFCSAGVRKGTVFCNGANYTVCTSTLVNQPSIDGIQTFPQFMSERQQRKNPSGAPISGEIDMACHTNAWKQFGMNLGSELNYQLFMLQAVYSSGFVNMTIS